MWKTANRLSTFPVYTENTGDLPRIKNSGLFARVSGLDIVDYNCVCM